MRIAFYAPLKSPTHDVPSGDRRVARLLVEALEAAGHEVELASEFRSLDIAGEPARQAALRDEGTALAKSLAAHWRGCAAGLRPELWFTYHLYYKAPDWLGPRISDALGIPYVVAEASHAPKREKGPWAMGHDAVVDAIRAAALVFCPTQDDLACIEGIVSSPDRIRRLPPFLDPAPYRRASGARAGIRTRLGADLGVDVSVPWIVVAAMMRPGDKLSSYRMLARVLARLRDLPWNLLVAGDGAARAEVVAMLDDAVPQRARILGECNAARMAEIFAACDLCIWPAINEAYGMALLEAQAAGVPVVSRAVRGVPDVVCDGRSGLLAHLDGEESLADLARVLLVDQGLRTRMGRAAAEFVAVERSMDAAAQVLGAALTGIFPAPADRKTGALPG